VTPDPDVDDDDRENLETLATEITERVEIRLEHEAHYDWVAFVPRARERRRRADHSSSGTSPATTTRSRYAVLGPGARPHRSSRTSSGTVDRLDRTVTCPAGPSTGWNATQRSPDAVLGRLERAIDEPQAGNVAVERLVERNRVPSRWKATHRIPRTWPP